MTQAEGKIQSFESRRGKREVSETGELSLIGRDPTIWDRSRGGGSLSLFEKSNREETHPTKSTEGQE